MASNKYERVMEESGTNFTSRNKNVAYVLLLKLAKEEFIMFKNNERVVILER